MKILTRFSKSVPDTIAVSVSPSAGSKGSNCDSSCRLWDNCYASRIERIYSGLAAKLSRHAKIGPAETLRRAMAEVDPARRYRWARLSVDGSLPRRTSMDSRSWRQWVAVLRAFIRLGKQVGAQWHIPVESLRKARTYRLALEGLGVIVRRSLQSDKLSDILAAEDCVSVVVGDVVAGCVTKADKAENIAKADALAADLRAAGKTAVNCPAIRSNSLCGQCTACADGRVDVVLYPFHG